MGKGRPRAVEKGVLGQSLSVSSSGTLNIPSGPVFYPTEEEFEDPLEYIYKIRPEAEPYGICRIVPPKSWKPPFALDLDTFTFPTKTQAIHQLQVRPPACDSGTFELEYNRFLEEHCGRKSAKRVVFEGEDLDLCKLFNAVKRYGGYDKVVAEKKWGEVFRFVRSAKKISECAKHVLCQLYWEHLYEYENYYNRMTVEGGRKCKRRVHVEKKNNDGSDVQCFKRRRRNGDGEKAKVCKEKKEELDQICEQCKSGLHGEVMLLCDRCNKGWHTYCLSPPLKAIPPGNWYCLDCLSSDKDSFGFVPGKCFSLEAFRRMAERAKKKWFGAASASRVQIEKKFWEIVEGLVDEVEVLYGSDLDTSVYGSGFPRINDERPQSVAAAVWDRYCTSPWNLNNLPKLQGSMLRAIHHNIAGVMVPWLYIGMMFSSFCWHFEDHCFYSMNYLHWGEPKCWYSVPGSEACAFEKVMRNSLPDLFDAQPDLLFQLVTMLNPSVLQENDVPVYSVLQEPGNFVITFPRSYHGGFNLGLNCAEAVNFAPADWLPHGGFGAGLYKLYRKAAVLSHEELLCVVAKNDNSSKVSPYLKRELLRIYAKEKTWRERLWRSGFINSSPMSRRTNPDYVGTEEDPTCIICHQYLYLSAVVCCCRSSAFACLEHWEHICECKPSKRRLLYRHTLAELSEMVLLTDNFDSEETRQNRNSRKQLSSTNDSSALTKKVKSGQVNLAQLAEDWILRSCNTLQKPFCSDAFKRALEEAEEFLWAGSEMDSVRDMAKNLTEAKKWAEGICECMSKVDDWSCDRRPQPERVHFEYVNKLLSFNPVPCDVPGHLKLKEYVEEARLLIQEINCALSSCSEISRLEKLHQKSCELPVYIEETEKLGKRISSAKICRERMRRCTTGQSSEPFEIDVLYMLKAEVSELQVEFPETEILLDLLRQAESCRAQCLDIFDSHMNLQKVKDFLDDFKGFSVNFDELRLLRQYYGDTVSWISRFNGVIANVHEQQDQAKVVHELKSILHDGASLKIQVDELPLVEIELKKACCREKALTMLSACENKVTLEAMQHLMMEAVRLEIDREQIFVDISGVVAAVMRLEERARHVLASESEMSDFEDIIRASEGICVILPALDDVKDAVSMAKSWLEKSRPFLLSGFSTATATSLLKYEALEELESQSKLLKVSLAEKKMLQTVLQNCMEWKHKASSLLEDANSLFASSDIDSEVANGLILKVEHMLTAVESVSKAGPPLGLDMGEISELQNIHTSLLWCYNSLNLCSVFPPLQEVERLVDDVENLPDACLCSPLLCSLTDGIKWLKRALELVCVPCRFRRCKLIDVEELAAKSQKLKVSFPVMDGQILNAVEKHKLWLEEAHIFMSLKPCDRSCPSLIQLKEMGMSHAFDCPELNEVLSESEKVEKWKLKCEGILGPLVGDVNALDSALSEIKDASERSLSMFEKSKECKAIDFCMCCSNELDNEDGLTCLVCKDCYHLRCLGLTLADTNSAKGYSCPYCLSIKSGLVPQDGGVLVQKYKGKRPELKMFMELISDAEGFFVRLEEKEMLLEIVEQTLACRAFLMGIVDFSLAYQDKDLSITATKLATALKALDLASVYDHRAYLNLELVVARHSWKVKVDKLAEGSRKPSIQQIQRLLKEGDSMKIPSADHFKQWLIALKCIGMQWADTAKKVATDSGKLGLDKVFELIVEGENLPVHFEKELKLLRKRSMLYCICRRPYDQRAMIACDQCDEWYHFDCINLSSAPKIYICPACKPPMEEVSTSVLDNDDGSTGAKLGEPQTPSPRAEETRRKVKKLKRGLEKLVSVSMNQTSILRHSSGFDLLLWRNRKPFRRATRKRTELGSLYPFFRVQP